jgi:HPt (histidine-containing phosphotransfer) domain-containing protein
MGRRELYLRVLRQFVEAHGGDAQRLELALQRGDTASASRLVHTLVSTAGSIGAESLAAAALALQQALALDNPASLPALLALFGHEHERVLASLRAHLQAQGV